MPFSAILGRRNRLALDEFSFPLTLIAVAVFAVLTVFHSRLFGGELF